MKLKGAFLMVLITIATVLAGCEPLMVLDPKGPQAERQASDIMLSIGIMSVIIIGVAIALFVILFKYRASNQSPDYEPPHIEGNPWVETILVGIPVLSLRFFHLFLYKVTTLLRRLQQDMRIQEPLVIYASSSNWKWHFSYPEEDIETVNYLYIPADRPIEFKLYSYGPITSFWIPQLGGQKYAMSDMVTTLHLAADDPGELVGRNANFSGKGFAENTFNVTAMTQAEFRRMGRRST